MLILGPIQWINWSNHEGLGKMLLFLTLKHIHRELIYYQMSQDTPSEILAPVVTAIEKAIQDLQRKPRAPEWIDDWM